MRLHFIRAHIVVAFFSLAFSVAASAQQFGATDDPVFEIFDCADYYDGIIEEAVCEGDVDEELLAFTEQMEIRAMEIAPYLPPDIRIDVLFDLSDEFSHKPGVGEADLITIGQGMMIDMWNSYVDVWDLYDYKGYDYDYTADFDAFLEWALYHEIGHALVEHSGYQSSDKDHERLADMFATVAMILMYGAGDESGMPAEQAAQGLFFLSLPEGQRQMAAAEGKRHAFARAASKKRPVKKRRGLDGNLGAHQPNPQRAWEIACLVYGSNHGRPPPGDYPVAHDTVYECQEEDYKNAILELDQYVPGMPDVEYLP